MSLTIQEIAIIKGMLARGDRQSDIAAWFGGEVNSGRVSEINTCSGSLGLRSINIPAAPESSLPPRGPYQTSGRSALRTRQTLEALRDLITETLAELDGYDADNKDAA